MESPKKIIVIGDLHADYDIFRRILFDRGVVDTNGNWCGGVTNVICMGDTFDGVRPGIRSNKQFSNKSMEFNLFKYILNLNAQASLNGGCCISIMGNHDAFIYKSNNVYCKKVDYESYPGKREKLFSPGSIFNLVLGNTRPLIITRGKYLFVHGGLTCELLKDISGNKIEQLNNDLYQWIVNKKEPVWLWDNNNNPMTTRRLVSFNNESEVDNLLKMLPGIEHIIVGHTYHPILKSLYNSKVICTDVGLSDAFGRNYLFKWQIIEIRNGLMYKVMMDLDGKVIEHIINSKK